MSRFEEELRNALNAQRGNALLRAYFGPLSTTEAEGLVFEKRELKKIYTFFSSKTHQNVLKARSCAPSYPIAPVVASEG